MKISQGKPHQVISDTNYNSYYGRLLIFWLHIRLVPFPKPFGDLTKQQLKALKAKKTALLYLPIKKLKALKKKVIHHKIKGVKLAHEFIVLLDILLDAFDTFENAATTATTVTDVVLSSGDPFPDTGTTGSTIPLVSGWSFSLTLTPRCIRYIHQQKMIWTLKIQYPSSP